MNNGITIIARHLQPVGNRFHIEDCQIVNGCQTSHVLFEVAREKAISDAVMIPMRLIATQNDDVINSIIRATNRQTEVKEEQFFALTEFPKQLEAFFNTYYDAKRLYYERRSRQYDSMPVEKTRIVTQANVTRAFAAMFLNVPHSVTRNYQSVREKIGTEMFGKDHRLLPYYVAAFALYRLEYLFRNSRIDPMLKVARFHMLLAFRLQANGAAMPPMNSHAMDKYCEPIANLLWDTNKVEDEFWDAAISINKGVSVEEWNRDTIRTQAFTEELLKTFSASRERSDG